jgi:hypothetical protein
VILAIQVQPAQQERPALQAVKESREILEIQERLVRLEQQAQRAEQESRVILEILGRQERPAH